ncbi:arachidonate 12-lipoxygenase, 12R-type-like [Periophthalmus magnuspinnatus]|uniref:arachidonate 12-lipoxygenase, 12R-type-like n=1 Tax=Periophthalmus magnuspinnatus TaxID=409849 RepID=UPI00145A77C8|nr:arachidonate 12-lipoxygenase, 12R-type-like [Periophthalmus magnuspinnatus]XP_033828574.1 arachidonate 12-lipoxygenase, 12R-type-like [Periophthalmus magnuspinnatus]
MVKYKVTVYTGSNFSATTLNKVFIKLVGEDGESFRTKLVSLKGAASFYRGTSSKFSVCTDLDIGKVLLIELDKQPILLTPKDAWFVDKVCVKTPDKKVYTFPIYRWIDDTNVHRFREATALRVIDDTHHLGRYSREQELKKRAEDYNWHVYADGLPHCIKTSGLASLPCEVQFSFTKTSEFAFTAATGLLELNLKGLANQRTLWKDFEEIDKVFCNKSTDISEYVKKHWREDAFFGYQYLNGNNPILIRRCTSLPDNFPVTDEMVFVHGCKSFSDEMQKGNIYLCDYKTLDGVMTNVINEKRQYLVAPLVLLHKTPDDKLKPIAIQLKQTPSDDNPIFVPSDSEYDWLVAKAFVKSADFSEHQLNVHLLRTHLLAEVFSLSLLRNMPMVHPLYKLLIPHTRYTLQINFLARRLLISDTGVFTQFASSGGKGMFTILRRSLSSMTYTSLCIPDDIAERGVESLPNYYYRDDGLRLWDIIHRFVKGVLSYYYKNDQEVKDDVELQKWIQDIYEHGFLSQDGTGIPQSFSTVEEMVKFVTMVIFTCSAQHGAVNSGQYDYGGWMPNTPITLQQPPPIKKGTATEASFLQTLPNVDTTVQGMATMWLLSRQSSDFAGLGCYPDFHFSEEKPLNLIHTFQEELIQLSIKIKERNKSLEVPYTYMDPSEVENSVAI